MALQHLLIAGGLMLAALSTIFLSRTFLRVGSADLWEIGAGAILGGGHEIFGVRWKLVQTACRQRGDSIVGLCMLLLGMLAQLVALFTPTSFVPVSKTMVLVYALVLAACALVIGRLCARLGARSFLEAKIKERVLEEVVTGATPRKNATLSSDRMIGYGKDIGFLLSGLSSPARIDAFSKRLFAEIEERLPAQEPKSAVSSAAKSVNGNRKGQ